MGDFTPVDAVPRRRRGKNPKLGSAGKARVVFDQAQLGYYAFPARERQGMLVPVYRFDGTVHGPEVERYEFSRHVIAVALSPEETKASRMTARGNLPAVFSQ